MTVATQQRKDMSVKDDHTRRIGRRCGRWNQLMPVVGLLYVLASCGYGRQSNTAALTLPTPTLSAQEIFTVSRGPVVETASFTGRVVLASQQELFFSTNGRIKAVTVQSGDTVAADQIIATLNTRDLEFAIQDARLALDLALQQLENAKEDLIFDRRNARLELKLARWRLDALRAQPQPESADLFMRELWVRQAQLRLDRLAQGVDPQLVTNVNRADLTLRLAQAALVDAQIVAPFSGEVRLFPGLVEGNSAEAWEPVALIVDPDSLHVEANLVAADLESLQEGLPVTIALINLPGINCNGEIYQMPQPFGSGTDGATKIALRSDGRQALLRAGSAVAITAEVRRAENTLWIPPHALHGGQDNRFVMVRSGNNLYEVTVEIGLQSSDRVEIVSGLHEGQVVVGS